MPTLKPPHEDASTALVDSIQTLQRVLPEIDHKRDHLKQLHHDADELTPILTGLRSFEALTTKEITLDEKKLSINRTKLPNTEKALKQKTKHLQTNVQNNKRFLKHLSEEIPTLEARANQLASEINQTQSEIQTLTNQRDHSIKHLTTFVKSQPAE